MSKTLKALKSAHISSPPSIVQIGKLSGRLGSALGTDARALRTTAIRAIKANPGTAIGVALGSGLLLGALGFLFRKKNAD